MKEYTEALRLLHDKGVDTPHYPKSVLEFLESVLGHFSEVLETGSGSSTIWLADHAFHIDSWEHDGIWAAVVRGSLLHRNKSNVTLHCEVNYSFGTFKKIDKQYNVVLLDGCDFKNHRVATMCAAPAYVLPGGYVLVDDADRPAYHDGLEFLESLKWTEFSLTGDDPYGLHHVVGVFRRPEKQGE